MFSSNIIKKVLSPVVEQSWEASKQALRLAENVRLFNNKESLAPKLSSTGLHTNTKAN